MYDENTPLIHLLPDTKPGKYGTQNIGVNFDFTGDVSQGSHG
jgi:hypothetical protein